MKKKYKVIAKVSVTHFVKYHVNDLLKFTIFLDHKFPGWRFFNVYAYEKSGKGNQIANFTSKSRPTTRTIVYSTSNMFNAL